MNNQDIAKHSAAMLDLFEAEQQRILLLDPKERAMQHNYQKTMAVCYELRTFIRSIDAKPSAVLEAAPASSAMANELESVISLADTFGNSNISTKLLKQLLLDESQRMQSQQSLVQAIEQRWVEERNQAFTESASRYEIVRKMNVPQFQAIYVENAKHGIPFDDLVDQFGKRASDTGRQG